MLERGAAPGSPSALHRCKITCPNYLTTNKYVYTICYSLLCSMYTSTREHVPTASEKHRSWMNNYEKLRTAPRKWIFMTTCVVRRHMKTTVCWFVSTSTRWDQILNCKSYLFSNVVRHGRWHKTICNHVASTKRCSRQYRNMPGIVMFKRRWSVGSDDMVIAAAFLALLHFVWWVYWGGTIPLWPYAYYDIISTHC